MFKFKITQSTQLVLRSFAQFILFGSLEEILRSCQFDLTLIFNTNFMHRLPLTFLFLIFFALLLALFFLIPIELFSGIIELDSGRLEKTDLSLSYFLDFNSKPEMFLNAKSYYLDAQGYFLSFCFLIGLPGLLTYRVWLNRFKE